MNIGVLTENGEMFIFLVDEKKFKVKADQDTYNESIEEFLSNQLDLGSGQFNWQELESEQNGSGFVNFRIIEV